MLVSFSFSSSGDHRDLHSFPTRRSSDLRLANARHGMIGASSRPSGRLPVCNALTICASDHSPSPVSANRSEEHTSELQSRQYLVCRLLLEKKKKSSRQRRGPPHHASLAS